MRGLFLRYGEKDGHALGKEFADGKETNNEKCGSREIAIFKDGVTL